ncbi:hypothetical protein [Halobacteriovorax sp. JY17]|uniref:hypothetical protein n=1 Tax=Halobacteriovorax sp. JY17 TaxID=2014617 RepID=UPI000C5EB309|nr:hypothetical protein [Halobacteriovorax sp. JY17]PIK15348.1 MAG: hypothetical protein CES88_01135 [Halobacteriovorax sp. JY17]
MKIALSCDDLLVRDHYTEIVETLGLVYEDSEIYTLVHKEKAMLGTVELRKIRSTYLSHKIKDREHLARNSYLIPNAASNLFIPCSVDLIINISNGMSQGIRKCENTKLITYFYDHYYLNRKKKVLREKLFKSYIAKWSKAALCMSDEIWVPNNSVKDFVESFYEGPVRVIAPPFNIADYPLTPKEGKEFNYFAINAQGMNEECAEKLAEFLIQYDFKFIFFGEDSHLDNMKYGSGDPRFLGVKCSGEIAPVLGNARAIIDVSENAFPEEALKGLSSGRPAILKESEHYKSYLGDYGILWTDGSAESLINSVKDMNNLFHTYERKKLYNIATGFHDIKFKSEVKRRVDHLMGNTHIHNGSDCCQ